MTKEAFISMRLPTEQKEQFERAAKRDGKTVAAWLRDLGARAVAPPMPSGPYEARGYSDSAMTTLREGKPPETFMPTSGPSRPRKTAAEIAASIPGVSAGVMSEQALRGRQAPYGAWSGEVRQDDPGESVPSWSADLDKWATDPTQADDDLTTALFARTGAVRKLPREFMNWTKDRKVLARLTQYLDREHPLEAK
jgi:hypothetical protein